MDREQLEFIKEHYEELGVEVLAFARRCAFVKYGLSDRDALLGQSIEDLVGGVFNDYLMGTRHLKPGIGILVQLKSAARSELWSLVKRKEAGATHLVEEGDEDEIPTSHMSKKQGPVTPYVTLTPFPARPDDQASVADQYKAILGLLWEHPKVVANDELASYIMAVEEGATTPAEIAEQSGLPIGRVYEARRSLISVYPEIKRKLNKIKDESYAK